MLKNEYRIAEMIANRVLDEPHRDPDEDICILARQLMRAREAINDIAKQKLVFEFDEEEVENADWMEGYESCIRRARAAQQNS